MSKFISTLQKDWPLLQIAFIDHIQLSFFSVILGIVISVPLGILLTRIPRLAKRVMAVLGILQTIPSMVMFGLLLPVTGIGKPTAIIVLTIYSILPILRNTYTGITEVSNGYIEAATGMGMNSLQILFRVELPLALPVIVTGIRLSSVYIISWATVAAIIGGGGLGDLIYTGLDRYNHAVVLMGAIPASLLAIATSFLIGQLAKLAIPRGLRREGNV
ncbi:MAG: ABC transporter permease [Oscillospiraceae bacterium]